jgi:uncharacterized protein YecE (DUF72 family)
VLYVGTSGWEYAHWRGRFFPARLPAGEHLAFYAARFQTVELNGTFYRLPERKTFEAWAARTPDDFVFAMKASRYLTHMKRLKDPRAPIERMLSRAEGLGRKLGPVLLQLPPAMRPDAGRLREALAAFAAGIRVTVEFRDERWFNSEVRGVLERAGAALCLADRDSRLVTPAWRTADWGYVRFHGGAGTPPGGYGRRAIEARAALIAEVFGAGCDVHAYFNNDGYACALRDAGAFARAARRAGLQPTRTAAAGEVRAG